MQWDKLENPSDADIRFLAERQNRKRGLLGGSRENHTLTLSINHGTIGDAGLTMIAQFPDLKDLSFFDDPEVDKHTLRISSGGWSMLPTCKTLHRLSLINCPLQIEDARAIGRINTLEALTLTQCDLTDAHIEQLTSLRKLTYLRLNLNRLTDACVKHLITFKSLTILHLAHNDFRNAGAREIEMSLSNCNVQFV